MSLMDRLNQQDLRTLYFAEQSIQQSWQMNREKLPHVTQRSLNRHRFNRHL
ncbi:DUF4113 domain-containing protein [Cronobacter malonaticus]|uniref:DUF4113 domain-containing protein n=1 Tax=Cronobacter malonaticus TaxID=413503 RepID=UPI0029C0A4A3|nr:DUF4113 domain-containing protein [Cronobacter malonaticus]